MLHHQPQIQFISQSQDKYQLINIDNCPEVLDKIYKMDQLQLSKVLEAIAYRFKEING